ncbi:MAG: 2Fe-2S iron-sulfur cluster-binding protein [Desulfosporosinus sp.]|nr:2Fe-2S iron-sulfur cluster-binding protein [Desulfosporosinus sp.]
MQIKVTINDKLVTWDVEKDEFLADTLRSHGFLSVKKACETSCCGLCTVWLEDKPVLSCSILSLRVQGKKITTIEGVSKEAEEFARVLTAEGAEQCGFCSPGFIMNVLALKNELVDPSEEEIIHYLTGNLCRCTGYMGQLRAVKTYLGVL